MLIISTALSSTIRESVWFLQLIPRVREIFANSHMCLNQYMDLFDEYGFHCVSAMNMLPLKGANAIDNYFDPQSLLDDGWRQSYNFFGMATEVEIKEMESAINEMKEKGTLERFVRDNDHTHKTGFSTIFACISKTELTQ